LTLLLAISVHAADSRPDFLKLIQHVRVPLAAEVEKLPSTNGLAQFHFSFAADAEQRVPGILMESEKSRGRRPAVIALHGTGGSKQNMLSLCRKLADAGFIAVAIDGGYHGKRTQAGKGSADYEDAIVRAWKDGREHPLYFDTVWDVMRLVDYLKTRKDVDAKRIGLIGISKGGIEIYLAAAADKRIAVAVACIGVQSFHWALANNDWQGRIGTIQKAFDAIAQDANVAAPEAPFVKKFYDRVVPGIDSEFDGPATLPLIAPRSLLVINGDSNIRTPLPGLEECTDAPQVAYRAAKAEDRFVVRIQEKTAHQVRAELERAAIAWFVKWLKP
jgi:dienelactone hydrolase